MKERVFFFYIFDIEIYFFHDLFKVKSLKKCVAVVLTMQLKVCNPHLGFFFLILSVWTKNVMKCGAAVTDASLLKDWSLGGIRGVILQHAEPELSRFRVFTLAVAETKYEQSKCRASGCPPPKKEKKKTLFKRYTPPRVKRYSGKRCKRRDFPLPQTTLLKIRPNLAE